MNINSNNIANISSRKKLKTDSMSTDHVSDLNSSKFNKRYQERPLQNNSHGLSFKGLFNNEALSFTEKEVQDAIAHYGKEFGSAAEEHFRAKIHQAHQLKVPGLDVKVENGKIKGLTFKDKDFKGNLAETLLAPFNQLPFEFVNGSLNLLQKIPGLKDSQSIKNALANKTLKNYREFKEGIANTYSVTDYIKLIKNGSSDNFSKGKRRLDPLIPDYSTVSERTLVRIVTGAVPALFLANDAYNLSMYMKNDKKDAEEAKKRRFNQEVARILITAGATFGVLKMFSKSTNESQVKGAILINIVTFASEFISRMAVGNPVLPINEKQAREYAIQRGKIKPDTISASTTQTTDNNKDKTTKPVKKETILTLPNVVKVLGSMIFGVYAVRKLEKVDIVKNVLNKINDTYNDLLKKDVTISKKDFEEICDKLTKEGFGSIAEKYRKMIEDEIMSKGNLNKKDAKILERAFEDDFKKFDKQLKELKDSEAKLKKDKSKEKDSAKKAVIETKLELIKNDIESIKKQIQNERSNLIEKLNLTRNSDETYYLGAKMTKPREAIIHQVLMFPIKYAWSIIKMPYNFLTKSNTMVTELVGRANGKKPEIKDKNKLTEMEMLQHSIEYLKKMKDDPHYKQKLNSTILSGFDNVTKSNEPNSEFSNIVKNTTSAVTSAFLIADNYNQVMIDTQGQDQDLAETKAKERTIQRFARLMYGACFLKLYNGLFAKLYNGSLPGTSVVNTIYTLSTETMERTSVGLPLHAASREEIIQKEKDYLSATGIKGVYFRTMAKITGKKPLSERSAA